MSFHLYNMQKEVQLIYTARNQKNWAIFLEIVNRKGHKGAFGALVTFFFLHWVVALQMCSIFKNSLSCILMIYIHFYYISNIFIKTFLKDTYISLKEGPTKSKLRKIQHLEKKIAEIQLIKIYEFMIVKSMPKIHVTTEAAFDD